VVQGEGRFQRDEVQLGNGSTRIRVDYRCEVTTAADGVFVKGFEQNVQASRIVDVTANRSITRWALLSSRASASASHKTGVVSMSILPIAVQTVVWG
jgi:hypothetical protein